MAALRRVDHGEEVGGELIVAGGDPAKVLQLGEEPFYEVTLAVKPLAKQGFQRRLPPAVCLAWRLCLDQVADAIGI